MLLYENQQNPYRGRKSSIKEFLRDNTSVYINPENSVQVKKMAASIAATGVKNKDAIHVACAILSECDYFLTTDIRLSLQLLSLPQMF